MNSRLEEWKEILESKELKISESKTEYIELDFGERVYGPNRERHEVIKISIDEVSEIQVFSIYITIE